jgi:hypothetical protein
MNGDFRKDWEIKIEMVNLINQRQVDRHVDKEEWMSHFDSKNWPPRLISTFKYMRKSIFELEEILLLDI